MKSIKIPGCNIEIGKGQPEYNVIHAIKIPGSEGEVIACFELTDLEVDEIVKNRKIFYSRLTFNQPFQPMRIFTEMDTDIELL